MRRGVAAVVVAAAAIGAEAFGQSQEAPRSSTWLARKLESGLSEALGGSVRIGRIDVDWTALAATIGDVAISVPADGAPPMTATIGEGRVQLAWGGLAGIAGGRIHITEVVAKQASFAISREWIDAWRPKSASGEKSPVEIRIDRLVVEGADAEYADGRQRVRVRASGLDLHGDWSTSRRSLVAEAQCKAIVDAPLFARPWSADVRSGLRLGAGRLEIFAARAEGPGATAELAGNVTWGAGASFTAEGRLNADLAALAPFLPGHLGMAGTVEGPVQIVFAGGAPIRVFAQADTKGFRIGPVATDTARAALTLRPGRLDAASIDARAYGGSFTGTVGLAFGHGTSLETDLAGRGADLARLVALAGKPLPVSSDADVTLKIVGDPAQVPTWSGGGSFDATPRKTDALGKVPAGGRGRLTFSDGHVRVQSGRLELGEAALALDFDADLKASPPALRLAMVGATRDAAATQRAALIVLDALGVGRNRFTTEPVAGSGRLSAVVRSARGVRVDLGLDLESGAWAGQPFDAASLELTIDDHAVDIARARLVRGDEELSGRLRVDARSGSVEDVSLRARRVGVGSLLAAAGLAAPVDGRLDLDLAGARIDGVLAAEGTLHASDLIVGREILDSVDAPIRIEGSRVILDRVDARGDAVDAHARVTYDMDTQLASVDLSGATLRLEACRSLAEAGLTTSGWLHASGPLLVDRDGPSGWLSLSANDLLLDTGGSGVHELRLGDLEGNGVVSPSGLELAVKAVPASAWTFDAFLGWSPRLPLSAVLYFEDLLVGAGGVFGESADVRMRGQVQAEGDLVDPRAMEVNGAFDEVSARFGSRTLRAVEPFALRLESGRFALGPSRFEGDDARIELSAGGSFDGAVEGRLVGTLDLGVVSSLWSDLRGAGALTIDATLGGRIDRPDLRGNVVLQDGRLRVLGYAQTLEHIDAEAVFEGQKLRLGNFHAVQGGGEVTASGEIDFEGLTPASFHARFDAANVSATFPEGFKGTYQGRIALDGTPTGATVAGRIDVVRGVYAREFDLGLSGGARREFGDAAESPFPRNVALDIDIVAPGNVWLRNEMARLEATGRLHVGGELTRPEVTGRLALVPGGTVRYRDVDYRLESGTLDLTDTKRINPYVDLRGRTRVADYDVTLHVEGTIDNFEYELTSLPPLSSQDIISLLVTGKTLESINSSSAASELPADMAAYYFAGLLNDTFGRQMQSSLGIDQFQITPLLLKGEGDPTARVTVGKRVNDSVKVVFSQDIGSAQKQTYQIVMDATRRIRLIAESGSDSAIGGEVQYSQQFGGAKPARETVAVADEPPGAVGSVQLQCDDGVVRTELIKAAKIRVGSGFDRGKMLEGGDRIRAALVKQGYLLSDVRSDAVRDVAAGGVYRIVYAVACGPKVLVEIKTTDGKGERSLRKTLKAFWRDTSFTPDLWDEATTVLLDDLQADGYYAAEVAWHASDAPGGRTVRFDVDRGEPVRLRSVRFDGVSSIPIQRIEAQMESLKKSGLHKRLLRPKVLTDDLAAVRALYRDQGFTQVRIGHPEVTLSAKGDAADVRVAIEEGARFEVGEVAYSEAATAVDEAMTGWSGLQTDQTFSPRRLAEAEQSLKERFDERGYPDVAVDTRVALVADKANVAFDVVPGERKTVGDIAIEGNVVTRPRTIARCLTFGRGDVVSRDELLKSQQRLYRTGLFSSVRLTFAPQAGSDPSAQKVTVKVEEAPPLTLGVGVGYDTEDGPRASFLLGYSNLGGRNVGISLQGFGSSKDDRAQLTLRYRQLFGKPVDSLASLFFEKSLETGYTQWRKSLSFRVEQRPRSRWIRFLRYTIQNVEIGDVTDEAAALNAIFEDKVSAIRLGSVGFGIVRDTRDDAFIPTRGGYGSFETNVFAQAFGSQASFVKVFLRGSWAVTFKRGSRFMSFLRIGAEQPFAGTDLVPLSERFFAGGSSTLRGFALDSIEGLLVAVPPPPAPPTEFFNAGGQALLVLNEEWHFPIWKSFRGELFLDVGNVYPTISDFSVRNIRSDAGVGLRIDTPIGAIRVEYGWKLDRQPGETPGEFVFAIGAVF